MSMEIQSDSDYGSEQGSELLADQMLRWKGHAEESMRRFLYRDDERILHMLNLAKSFGRFYKECFDTVQCWERDITSLLRSSGHPVAEMNAIAEDSRNYYTYSRIRPASIDLTPLSPQGIKSPRTRSDKTVALKSNVQSGHCPLHMGTMHTMYKEKGYTRSTPYELLEAYRRLTAGIAVANHQRKQEDQRMESRETARSSSLDPRMSPGAPSNCRCSNECCQGTGTSKLRQLTFGSANLCCQFEPDTFKWTWTEMTDLNAQQIYSSQTGKSVPTKANFVAKCARPAIASANRSDVYPTAKGKGDIAGGNCKTIPDAGDIRRQMANVLKEIERRRIAKRQGSLDITAEPSDERQEKQLAKRCVALHKFKPVRQHELALDIGDVVDIRRQIDANWFEGQLGERVGIFPKTFVSFLEKD